MAARDDLMVFAEAEPGGARRAPAAPLRPWKVLIVDDEDVHEATEYAMRGCSVLGHPLAFLHAHSGAQAIEVLSREKGIAVILLDAVMETEDAGLRTIRAIRDELALSELRIIMRTGQPGQVPELDTISQYDINDYKTKGELTRDKLLITLITAVRSYDQLRRIEASRRGLSKIVAASNQFIAEQGLLSFADGVITQIAGLIGVEPEGLVCACKAFHIPIRGSHPADYEIIAAAGRYSGLINTDVERLDDRRIADSIIRCFDEKRTIIEERSLTMFFQDSGGKCYATWIGSEQPILDVNTHLIEVFCSNISLCADNIELVSKLRRQAYEDSLVGLPNLSAFIEKVEERAAPGGGEGFAIALIDLAQFGALNDMLGHRHGDRLLQAVARRLEAGLPAACVVARAGTDVFGVLGEAETIGGDRIMRLFSEPLEVEGAEQSVSASIGYAALDGSSASGADFLKNAHIALKRAKVEGIGSTVWYSKKIGSESRERNRLLHSLRADFGRDRLFLMYQPQVELAGGRPVGFEALMRWTTADGRLVPPDLFIPVAEYSGLIRPMGAWLLRTSLAALLRLKESAPSGLRMAINVSAVQLRDPDFLPSIDRALVEFELAGADLELEITESISMFGIAGVRKLLGEIKERGISIAVDDFGTGYSSLSSIDSWPVDRLKIDRSFVAGMEPGGGAPRIVDLVIPLGLRLSMRVLAEGVETEAQAARLRELGCEEAQGYYFGKPMILEEAAKWLERY
jgi:diguanylate cyclase